jgi:DNA-binding SARP family transcriptional activator
MDFRVLGALEVWAGDGRIALPGARHERILAALLLTPNAVVPVARLVEIIWDDEPPVTATKQIQNCVSGLRALLGCAGGAIVTDGRGYRLIVTADEVDALRFERELGMARRLAAEADLAGAVEVIGAGLRTWRGPALDGLGAGGLAGPLARLDEQRINAIELRASWQLELGDYHAVIEELTELVAQHPLRERPHAVLMAALDRSGRQADALAVFRDLRQRLVDELGVDPSAELCALHARILGGQPDTEAPPGLMSDPHANGADVASVQLGRAVRHLAAVVGRQWSAEAEMRSLNRPAPVPLSWSSTTRPVSATAAAVVGAGVDRPVRLELTGELSDLVATFRRIPSRQLVVLGEPGAGKSVLAILLTLGLLADPVVGEPVPVLLPLESWNPEKEHLHHWLAAKLVEEYPGLANTAVYGRDVATRLVLDDKIIPVLDGLDETPPAFHHAVIDALDQAVAGGRPLVVTCRSAEYAAAVRRTGCILTRAAVVEIEPVRLDAAVSFLTARAPASDMRWGPVAAHLRDHPDGALARALRTPLMVDLTRTAYAAPDTDPADPCDTDRFPDPESVEHHLLDSYLPATYTHRPSPPAHDDRRALRTYDPAQAQRWLGFLAARLSRRQTRDIAWWRLDNAVRAVTVGLYLGLPPAPFFAAAGWFAANSVIALVYGLCFGAAGVVAHTLGQRPGPLQVELRFRHTAVRFLARFAAGTLIGVALGLGWDLPSRSPACSRSSSARRSACTSGSTHRPTRTAYRVRPPTCAMTAPPRRRTPRPSRCRSACSMPRPSRSPTRPVPARRPAVTSTPYPPSLPGSRPPCWAGSCSAHRAPPPTASPGCSSVARCSTTPPVPNAQSSPASRSASPSDSPCAWPGREAPSR